LWHSRPRLWSAEGGHLSQDVDLRSTTAEGGCATQTPLLACRARAKRSGFTLIEIMFAVLLMALLTAAAAFSFSGPIRAARSQDAIQQIRTFDESARLLARNSGRPVRVVFDLTANTISRREGQAFENVAALSALPSGYQLDRVRVEGRDYSDPEAVIDYSPLGLSRSYAVHVVGPGLDRWALVAGTTGQVTQWSDESAIDSILENAAPTAYRP